MACPVRCKYVRMIVEIAIIEIILVIDIFLTYGQSKRKFIDMVTNPQDEFILKKLHAETIEDVIMIMDEIIRNSRLRGSRIAFFTVLYRTTTYLVKKYCDEGGFFEDDERMRQLDIIFANFYFDSLFADLHNKIEPPSTCWKITFDATDDPDAVLIQHLLVDMNAHISLDLGVATALIADGDLNDSLRRDY